MTEKQDVWQMVSVGDNNPKYAIADADRVSILTIAYEDEVPFAAIYDEDHARLIAQAPAMLDALREMCAILDMFADGDDGFMMDIGNDIYKSGLHQKITAVIAAATGEAP